MAAATLTPEQIRATNSALLVLNAEVEARAGVAISRFEPVELELAHDDKAALERVLLLLDRATAEKKKEAKR